MPKNYAFNFLKVKVYLENETVPKLIQSNYQSLICAYYSFRN